MNMAFRPSIVNPRIRAKAAILIRYLVLLDVWIGIDFLRKILVHSFHFVLSLSLFAVRFSLTKTNFLIILGGPSA